jgi:WhiB family redox-sensing transcriptional regulator
MGAAAEIVDVPADMGAVVAFMRRYRELERLEAGWREQAACTARTIPPLRHFFPDPTHLVPGSKKIRRARRVCARCPVRRPCLELVVDEDLGGVWAGTTDDQREATAGLPREQRIEALEQMAYEATTSGPWRVASDEEWRVAGLAYTPETEYAPAEPG